MTTPFMRIGDGTVDIDILPGPVESTGYGLRYWTPSVPGRRRSPIANKSSAEDVIEELGLMIVGDNAAEVYERLETLNLLLDQAEGWSDDDGGVTAVLFQYAPAGSAVSSDSTPLKAAILGRASGNETSGVGLTPQWVDASHSYQLDVVLRFWRRGWLLVDIASASSGATDVGSIATVDLGAALASPGPTKLTMSNYPTAGSESGILLISSNDGGARVAIKDPSSGTAVGWTAIDDTANHSRFSYILRYTPTDDTEKQSGSFTLSMGGGPLYAVYVCVRNNSATAEFAIRANVAAGGGYRSAYTPYRQIKPYVGSAQPQWVLLGVVPYATSTMRLLAQATNYANSLDFGAVAILDVSYRYSHALTFGPSAVNGNVKEMIIDHQLLTRPEPTGSGSYPFDVKGDMVIETLAQNIDILSLICGASNDWLQYQAIGAVVANNDWTLDRYSAYLTPR